MARFTTILQAVTLIAIWCTCSAYGATQNVDSKYEALASTVNELKEKFSALERERSTSSNSISDANENRNHLYYNMFLYNQNHIPKYDLGRLRKMPSSCSDLSYAGEIKNGWYIVTSGQSLKIVFCDFWKEEGSAGYETPIGSPDIKSSPVYFTASRNSSPKEKGYVRVTYEMTFANTGGSLNITNGVFTAPQKGTYYLSFNGVVFATADKSAAYCHLRKNDWNTVLVSALCHQNKSMACSLSLHTTVQLQAGDKVWVDLNNDKTELYDDQAHYTQFTGWLVDENISSRLPTQF